MLCIPDGFSQGFLTKKIIHIVWNTFLGRLLRNKLFLLSIVFSVVLSCRFVIGVEASSAMWSQTYGGTSNDVAYSLVVTSDGGFAVAGYTESVGAGDFWLVKTDADGNMEWNQTYGGTHFDYATSVVAAAQMADMQ